VKLHLTATGNHLPYGITQCYLPPGRGDFPAFTPAEAGTRFNNPEGMQGWVDLGTTGVNSLPKTATRQRRDCDSNPCSSEPESGTLTTRPPSQPLWIMDHTVLPATHAFIHEWNGMNEPYTLLPPHSCITWTCSRRVSHCSSDRKFGRWSSSLTTVSVTPRWQLDRNALTITVLLMSRIECMSYGLLWSVIPGVC